MEKVSAPLKFSDLLIPKLITVLREGYNLAHLRADILAGLTVAIVALPLSMAIGIASGATPTQGLVTAIVGGLLVSGFGGSRFQIGGPAGAFTVLIAATIQAHGMDGLFLAMLLAGAMLIGIGLLRLGTFIKFVPYPVTVGFTAGIAVIIFASQIKDFLGLSLAGPEPGPILDKLPELWRALPTTSISSMALASITIVIAVTLKSVRSGWPSIFIAIACVSTAAALLGLPVETVGSKFGGVDRGLPSLKLPDFDIAKAQAVLPSAIAFAMLGSIESLLSAVVADGMTGRRHRSNCELVAQGAANIASALFGGICVTGTIARTATNVRAGAHGPIAGVLHAIFLAAFVFFAAPLASFIPLASLAGVLAIVAWNMVEKAAFLNLLRASPGDRAVLLVTFGLTIFRDLTEAILVGFALGSALFIHGMSKRTGIKTHIPYIPEDAADNTNGGRTPYDEASARDPDIVVYRISGAFFFGAAAYIGAVLDQIGDRHRVLIIDFSDVLFVNSTAANTIEMLAKKEFRRKVRLFLTGVLPEVEQELRAHGLEPPLAFYEKSIESALSEARLTDDPSACGCSGNGKAASFAVNEHAPQSVQRQIAFAAQ